MQSISMYRCSLWSTIHILHIIGAEASMFRAETHLVQDQIQQSNDRLITTSLNQIIQCSPNKLHTSSPMTRHKAIVDY